MPDSVLPLDRSGQVLVTGSLAFDQIMVFDGNFKDHILADKLHVINISFLVNEMKTQRGGCAGNIAYTLALLGERARVIAAAGSDFAEYRTWLERHGVDTRGVLVVAGEKTACCHITTDKADNQITGFFVGAMQRASDLSLAERKGDEPALAIVAPDDPGAMLRHAAEARATGIPFLFDPSFQVTAMAGEDLAAAAEGAAILCVNDYELAVFRQKTGLEGDAIFDRVGMVVVTLGKEGSRVLRRGRPDVEIPAAPVERVLDPTGAGDAFRGGFVAGLMRGFGLDVCGRMGSLAAAYAVEQSGTQNHAYTAAEFAARYEAAFGPLPADPRG